MKIADHIWKEAQEGVRMLRESGDTEIAASIERLIYECRNRQHMLMAERKRNRKFREETRAKVHALMVKIALGLGESPPVEAQRKDGRHKP